MLGLSVAPSTAWTGPQVPPNTAVSPSSPSALGENPADETPSDLSGIRDNDAAGIIRDQRKSGRYSIEARFDAKEHKIQATLKLHYINRSSLEVTRIPFYTYLNAMSHSDTPWMRSSGASHRGHKADLDHLGYLDLQSIRVTDTPPPDSSASPGKPPEQGAPSPELPAEYSADKSIIWVELPRALAANQSIDFEIKFVSQLPRAFSRNGYSPGFVLASMWYPKPAVLGNEGWQATPFSFHGEFFSDFADYDVWLDLPMDYVALGSGFEDASQLRAPSEPGRHWHHRRADQVLDFAWSAATQWRRFMATVGDVEIDAAFAPEYAHEGPDHLALQVEALTAIQKRFGPYPWRNISFVMPPSEAPGTWGMEYATFFTTAPFSNFRWPRFLADRPFFRSLTTLHEFSHQYFPGLVASNESQDPWLDEGLATYSEILLYHDIYGPEHYASSLLGHTTPAESLIRIGLSHDTVPDVVQQHSASYPIYPHTYSTSVYTKAALALLTLRRLCGPQRFDAVLRDYVQTFRFLHPRAQDFRNHLIEGLGGQCEVHPELKGADGQQAPPLRVEDYLQQVLDRPFTLDFRAKIYPARVIHPSKGYRVDSSVDRRGDEHRPPQWEQQAQEHRWEQFVVLRREGEVHVPVVVKFIRENGECETRVWSANSSYRSFRFVADHPQEQIRRVHIDPEAEIGIEAYRSNNIELAPQRVARPEESWFRRISNSFARALQVALWGMFS